MGRWGPMIGSFQRGSHVDRQARMWSRRPGAGTVPAAQQNKSGSPSTPAGAPQTLVSPLLAGQWRDCRQVEEGGVALKLGGAGRCGGGKGIPATLDVHLADLALRGAAEAGTRRRGICAAQQVMGRESCSTPGGPAVEVRRCRAILSVLISINAGRRAAGGHTVRTCVSRCSGPPPTGMMRESTMAA